MKRKFGSLVGLVALSFCCLGRLWQRALRSVTRPGGPKSPGGSGFRDDCVLGCTNGRHQAYWPFLLVLMLSTGLSPRLMAQEKSLSEMKEQLLAGLMAYQEPYAGKSVYVEGRVEHSGMVPTNYSNQSPAEGGLNWERDTWHEEFTLLFNGNLTLQTSQSKVGYFERGFDGRRLGSLNRRGGELTASIMCDFSNDFTTLQETPSSEKGNALRFAFFADRPAELNDPTVPKETMAVQHIKQSDRIEWESKLNGRDAVKVTYQRKSVYFALTPEVHYIGHQLTAGETLWQYEIAYGHRKGKWLPFRSTRTVLKRDEQGAYSFVFANVNTEYEKMEWRSTPEPSGFLPKFPPNVEVTDYCDPVGGDGGH